jgi:hypothetical protein
MFVLFAAPVDLWPLLLVVSRFLSSEDIVQMGIEAGKIGQDHFDSGDR